MPAKPIDIGDFDDDAAPPPVKPGSLSARALANAEPPYLKGLNAEQDCSQILHILSAFRGAVDGLMAEVIEGHILLHIVDPNKKATSEQSKAAQDLIDVIKSYLK